MSVTQILCLVCMEREEGILAGFNKGMMCDTLSMITLSQYNTMSHTNAKIVINVKTIMSV